MREQIRLWFYSQCFMAVTLDGRSAVPRGADVREGPRRDRAADAQVVGKRDRANEALERMGADVDALAVLRRSSRARPQLRLRTGRRGEAAAADVLELRLVLRHLRERREQIRRRIRTGRAEAARPVAGRADARSSSRHDRRLRALLDARRRAGVRGLRRRSLELVHPPLAAPLLGGRRDRVARAVGRAEGRAARDLAGDAVPAEHLWRSSSSEGRRPSSSAAGRSRARSTTTLLAEVAEVRRVVELGPAGTRRIGAEAASAAAAPRRRGRQLAAIGHEGEIAEELRVKEVEFGEVEASELRVKPNLRRARAEARHGAARRAHGAPGGPLRGARRGRLPRGRPRARARRGVRRARRQARAGRSRRTTASPSRSTRRSTTSSCSRVACSTSSIRSTRCGVTSGLELTDRIRLSIPDEDLLAYAERIKEDTLAVSVEVGELRLEKA